ncbi:hypothetical protein DFQ28_003015 [Apophysomyces sp. BC1034]|nr:hypothetical protein DFQ30_011385 [Apophysomyces sp. BC1015]KAG0177948.1 hypothetical protein DFQ29_004132 [Apophysomyces sp. BC1021]KAG0193863.1 hypothetical protein DFQ28_003015 [Apophysomyces sp. BC1034]
MTLSTSTKTKPLKWTTQRVNIKSNRTPKRINKSSITKVKAKKPPTELERIETELAFTYDVLATINVHYDSLKHAYTDFKPSMEESANPLQLCDMEKELLTAYDDLGLQVTHLERKLIKLEKSLLQLRSEKQKPARLERIDTTVKYEAPELSPTNSEMSYFASPCSTTTIADFFPPPIPLMAHVEETPEIIQPIVKDQQTMSFFSGCSVTDPYQPLAPPFYPPTHDLMPSFDYALSHPGFATWSSSSYHL